VNVRRLAAAALTAAALLTTAGPASATCYLGDIDICNKPTDPYTDPVTRPVNGVVHDVIVNPTVQTVIWTTAPVVYTVSDVYGYVVCTALC
jgi:hypothetical protein